MGKKSNLTHQAIKELNKECHFGQSKYEAKQQAKANGRNPALVSGIYSQATYNSYVFCIFPFTRAARQYEFLQSAGLLYGLVSIFFPYHQDLRAVFCKKSRHLLQIMEKMKLIFPLELF